MIIDNYPDEVLLLCPRILTVIEVHWTPVNWKQDVNGSLGPFIDIAFIQLLNTHD